MHAGASHRGAFLRRLVRCLPEAVWRGRWKGGVGGFLLRPGRRLGVGHAKLPALSSSTTLCEMGFAGMGEFGAWCRWANQGVAWQQARAVLGSAGRFESTHCQRVRHEWGQCAGFADWGGVQAYLPRPGRIDWVDLPLHQ